MQICLKVRMYWISRIEKQMTYKNGFEVSFLFPDMIVT